MPDEVTTTLEHVAAGLPGGGESRPGQVEMAVAVATSMAGGRHLVVQAGTGTGKSLAYLVPAALSGERVVVATATKALQDQLADKDLPMVAAATDRGLTFAVLKGRSNYVCRQRVSEIGGTAGQLTLAPGSADPPDADDPLTPGAGVDTSDPATIADQVRALVRWAGDTTTGDRAELPFEPHFRAWAMVSTTARECPGAFRCPSGRDCCAEDARARAAEADVIVVNTHLYGAHLASGGMVLPEHQVVVFDEAHEVEDVMTDSLGLEVGPGRFRALATAARPVLDTDDDGAGRAADAVADLADVFHRVLRPWSGRRVPHQDLAGGDGPPAAARPEPTADVAGLGTRAGERAARPRPRAGPATRSPHPGGGDHPGTGHRPGADRGGQRPGHRHPPGPGHRPGRAPGRSPAQGRARSRRRRGVDRAVAPGPGAAGRRPPGRRPGPTGPARAARRWPGWRTATGRRPCGSPPSTSARSWPSSCGARSPAS